jgi:hypothetical protein
LLVHNIGGTLSEEQEIREAVDAAKSPKTFSIINVLAERSYPKAVASVSLDEGTAYKAATLKAELDELIKNSGTKGATQEHRTKIDDMTSKLEELTREMMKHSYTFHITGISEGKREELAREAKKKYPIEYDKSSQLSSLIGGSSEPIEKPSPERDNLFTDLLWKEHIEKIEDPEGNVQESLSYNDIKSLRGNLPLSSLAKINATIERVRTATAVFMMETGEDFLAKP